jgi:hypothetical protein
MDNSPLYNTGGPGKEIVNEAGNVVVDRLTLRTFAGKEVSITNFCLELSLHEDLFSNVLFGECVMIDSANLITTLPIQGTEYLTIRYRTPTLKTAIERTFIVVAIRNRNFTTNDSEQGYILEFMSPEGVMDEQIKISRKFSGPSSEVIGSIFQNYLRQDRVIGKSEKSGVRGLEKPTASTTSFVSPYWSPLKCINWICNTAQHTQTSAPNYLFFETNKSFYCTSIEHLIVTQRNQNRVFNGYYYSMNANMVLNNRRSTFKYTASELDLKYQMVSRIRPFSQFDALRGWEQGHYASTLITHDIVRKQLREYTYDHRTGSQKFDSAEDYTVSGGSIQSATKKNTSTIPPSQLRTANNKRSFYSTHTGLFDKTRVYQPHLTVQARNSLLHDLSTIRLEIEVPGRTDIEAGQLLEFFFPKAIEKVEGADVTALFDPYLSGLYLIVAIRHLFSLNKHTMYLEIVKDSYPTPLVP